MGVKGLNISFSLVVIGWSRILVFSNAF